MCLCPKVQENFKMLKNHYVLLNSICKVMLEKIFSQQWPIAQRVILIFEGSYPNVLNTKLKIRTNQDGFWESELPRRLVNFDKHGRCNDRRC